jgi:hypothetical protein
MPTHDEPGIGRRALVAAAMTTDAVLAGFAAVGDGLRRAVSALRWLRDSMRRAGLEPPTLGPELEQSVAGEASTPEPADAR